MHDKADQTQDYKRGKSDSDHLECSVFGHDLLAVTDAKIMIADEIKRLTQNPDFECNRDVSPN